ncbi:MULTISPECIES: GGDEF domain-containing protein [unclassified Acidovorax]|uniref:GGDEF domain-containing protein n=1 Tax=unclassified Acidovorax TaxID=2684926 RepID=UPI002883324D|nr:MULTISPECIES: GGDEF domain-containing protein [unclassified Acidovorax]
MSLSRLLRLMGLLLALVTATLVLRTSADEWHAWRQADEGALTIERLRLGLLAAEYVSRERGPANARLGAADGPPEAAQQQALEAARAHTDTALAQLAAMLHAQPPGPLAQAAPHADAAIQALARARTVVDGTIALPSAQRSADSVRASVYGMVAVVPLLAPVTGALGLATRQTQPALQGDVQTLLLTTELREHAGVLGSHFTAALACHQPYTQAGHQPFTQGERLTIERTRGHIAALKFLIDQRVGAPDTPPALRQAWAEVQTGYFQHAMLQVVGPVMAAGVTDGRYSVTAAQFAERYVPELTKVIGLRDAMLAQLLARTARAHEAALRSLLLVIAASATLVAVLTYALVTLQQRVLRPLAQTTLALQALARNELNAPLPRIRGDDEGAAVVQAVRALQKHTRARQVLERERNGLIAQLREQSRTDFLTGLPNRRAFFESAAERIAQAQRHGFGVAVLLLDVDAFKAFNDRAGHTAGDEALRTVASALRAALRTDDVAARYGGEEFVVLLGPCDSSQAALSAERVRAAIAAAPVALPTAGTAALTASLGVAASQHHGLDLAHLLSEADAALYRAKRAGRNRVVVAERAEQGPNAID